MTAAGVSIVSLLTVRAIRALPHLQRVPVSALTKPVEVTIFTKIKNRFDWIHSNLKEDIMVEVTPSATQQITEYFKGKDVTPIRIFLNEGG